MLSEISVETKPGTAVDEIKAGLEAALFEEGVEIKNESIGGLTAENVKIQKMVYRVSEDWELPIIRTWYRYGQFLPYNTLREVRPQQTLSPETTVHSGTHGSVSVEDITGYFIENNLKELWEMGLFEFLEQNYSNWAPEDFREAYLANLRVLHILENLIELDDSEVQEQAPDLLAEIKPAGIDLRYELRQNELFSDEVVSHFTLFIDTLQEVLTKVQLIDSLDPMQLQAIHRAYKVYHGYVWPWPAMIISIKEAKVPTNEGREFTPKGERLLSRFSDTMPTQLNGWKNEVRDVDLLPTTTEYQMNSNFNNLSNVDRSLMVK